MILLNLKVTIKSYTATMKKFNSFLQKINDNNGNGCLCFLRPGITGIISCT